METPNMLFLKCCGYNLKKKSFVVDLDFLLLFRKHTFILNIVWQIWIWVDYSCFYSRNPLSPTLPLFSALTASYPQLTPTAYLSRRALMILRDCRCSRSLLQLKPHSPGFNWPDRVRSTEFTHVLSSHDLEELISSSLADTCSRTWTKAVDWRPLRSSWLPLW